MRLINLIHQVDFIFGERKSTFYYNRFPTKVNKNKQFLTKKDFFNDFGINMVYLGQLLEKVEREGH